MDPVAFITAVNATNRHARSALPDAPAVLEPPRRRRAGAPAPLAFQLRSRLAAGLRRLAEGVEPRVAAHGADVCRPAL